MWGVRIFLAALLVGGCLIGIAHAQSTVTVGVSPGTFVPGSTVITYTTDNLFPSDIYINIVDSYGHTVRTIYDGNRSSGTYTVSWNGKDNSGVRVPDGTYTVNVSLYRFDASQPVAKGKPVGKLRPHDGQRPYGIAVNSTGYRVCHRGYQ